MYDFRNVLCLIKKCFINEKYSGFYRNKITLCGSIVYSTRNLPETRKYTNAHTYICIVSNEITRLIDHQTG